MDFVKEAITQNAHWETGEIHIERAGERLIERDLFPTFEKAAGSKFIVLLRGLRRTGKSVLARQLMQKLMQSMDPEKLCWFEFDRGMGAGPDELDSLIRFFRSRGGRIMVFDEVMFVQGWQDVIKRHYDSSDVRFIVTGSSALEMDKRSAESLAGRFRLIKVRPFTFGEYLRLREGKMPRTGLEMAEQEQEMVVKCDGYLRAGGMPEADVMRSADRREYIKASLLDPVFFKDVPAVFPSANPDLLLKTLELLSATAGSPFQFQTLAQVLGCSHPTVATQVELLERALLAWQVFNYTPSMMKQKRTAKKIVIGDNGILSVLNPSVSPGALAENAVAQSIDARYFWRDTEKREVDFVMPDKKLAIEVKYQEHVTSVDERHLRYFLGNNPEWKGMLITKNDEDAGKIRRVPLWKWLLQTASETKATIR